MCSGPEDFRDRINWTWHWVPANVPSARCRWYVESAPYMFDELSQAKRAMRNALLTIATLLLLWWIWEDRPSPIAPWQAPAKALRNYIEAARRHDCAAVVAARSKRSQELAAATAAGRANLERSMCEYTPATAKLPEFETNRIRVEHASRSSARVSASFTYDRFFGFFGRG